MRSWKKRSRDKFSRIAQEPGPPNLLENLEDLDHRRRVRASGAFIIFVFCATFFLDGCAPQSAIWDPHFSENTLTPAQLATTLGAYKANVYRAVGARWYRAVKAAEYTLPVGMVNIQYTVHADGSLETKVLSGTDPKLKLLLSISLAAVHDSAPFSPFSEALEREVGRQFTDRMNFHIYAWSDKRARQPAVLSQQATP